MSKTRSSSNHDEFLHWIDISPPKRTVNDFVELAGWCYVRRGGRAGEMRVRIRNLLGFTVLNKFQRASRPDVVTAFPSDCTSPACGFHFLVPVRLGASVLNLEAKTDDDKWALVTRTFV